MLPMPEGRICISREESPEEIMGVEHSNTFSQIALVYLVIVMVCSTWLFISKIPYASQILYVAGIPSIQHCKA